MTALELRGVGKTYPGSPPVAAVSDASMRVDAGELVAVVGASGSGKSTLLNLCGTLERPTVGSVIVAGVDSGTQRGAKLSALRAAHIGFVFQQFHLVDGMSALDNVATGLLYRGVAAPERRRRAAAALHNVGLDDRAAHRPTQLSGGERQRVAIARALVGEPSIVLADEPTGNLDSRAGAAIRELLLMLNADGATIIVVTHNPELAAGFPRTVTLHDGRVVRDTGSAS
jgi:putative ABC transport system ATP-binding protein